jgi:hypothetical protein
VFEARVFIGECLARAPDPLVVWFQRKRSDSDEWLESIQVAFVAGDSLVVEERSTALPPITETIDLVNGGSCREILDYRK